jgi:multidrug efflux pump subunit AcrB
VNRAEVFGEHAARRPDLLGVPAATGTAVLGVFLLLQGAFASWRLAPAFVALPTALAGAVCALTVRRTLERGSVAGMLLVFGLATPSRLLLIRHCRHLRDVEALSPARVERAAHERQRPVLVTAVVAGVTFPPLPFLGDAPVWGSLRRWP